MNNPRIRAVGRANPPLRLTQEQVLDLVGYKGERIRKIFLNSDIDYRHFYLEPENFNRESSRSPLQLCLLPPVFLDYYLNDAGGYDVLRLPQSTYA